MTSSSTRARMPSSSSKRLGEAPARPKAARGGCHAWLQRMGGSGPLARLWLRCWRPRLACSVFCLTACLLVGGCLAGWDEEGLMRRGRLFLLSCGMARLRLAASASESSAMAPLSCGRRVLWAQPADVIWSGRSMVRLDCSSPAGVACARAEQSQLSRLWILTTQPKRF